MGVTDEEDILVGIGELAGNVNNDENDGENEMECCHVCVYVAWVAGRWSPLLVAPGASFVGYCSWSGSIDTFRHFPKTPTRRFPAKLNSYPKTYHGMSVQPCNATSAH